MNFNDMEHNTFPLQPILEKPLTPVVSTPSHDTNVSTCGNCFSRWFGPIGAGSLRGATLSLSSITFGVGCLVFPAAVKVSGPILSLLFFIFVAAANFYTEWILIKAGNRTSIMDYNKLIEKTMGKRMVTFYDINNIILCIGVIMAYQKCVYDFALDLLNFFFQIDPLRTDVKWYLILVCYFFIQVPLGTLKNISKLQFAAITATIALIYCVLVITVEMPFYFTNYLSKPENSVSLFENFDWRTNNYIDTFAVFMFGFNNHNGILQVLSELANPSMRRYEKCLIRSFYVEIILYFLISFCGYFSTFSSTPDFFISRPDLPGFTDYFIKIAKLCIFICLHCVMAINYNIMRLSIRSVWNDNQPFRFLIDFIITLITFAVCNLIVFSLKEVIDIIGVIGGFSTVVSCFIIPIMIHVILSQKKWTSQSNILALLIMMVMSVLGVIATVKSCIGTLYAVISG